MLLSPANSNGALTCLLPLIGSLRRNYSVPRTLILIPSHRLTLRVRRIFGSVKANVPIVDYCKNQPTVSRRHAVGKIGPRIVVNAPKHVGSRLNGKGVSTSNVRALIVSRFSGYLRVNFRRRVTRILGRVPCLGQHFLLSTASTPTVPHFISRNDFIGLSFLGTSRRVPSEVGMCHIRSPRGSGLRALSSLLYGLKSGDSLIFMGCHRDIRHICHFLRRGNVTYRVFRKKVRRGSQRHTLCGFDGNSYGIFISASLTTHNLSVPSVSRIVRCRLPLGRSTCVRHGNHATQ